MTCKRGSDDTDPVVPETGLKILELHLAGIPDKKITIDQDKRLIRIVMPETLPADGIKADYKLTSDARLYSGLEKGYLRARDLNKCNTTRIILQKANPQPGDLTVEYSIVTVAAGKLTPNPTTPLELELSNSMRLSIPALNLYGSEALIDALVTREGSSEKISLMREPSPHSCLWFSFDQVTNQVHLSTYRQLQPGRYALELVQIDGTVVPVPQPLLVKKGAVFLGSNPWRWSLVTKESFRVEGYNLFKGDISLTIANKHQTYQPLLSDFAADGTGFQVAVPVLDPGVYFVKISQHGQEMVCHKLNVLTDKNQPLLKGLGNSGCMNFETLPLVREKQQVINYTPATAARQPDPIRLDEQLQLINTGNPSAKFNIPIVPYGMKGSDSPAYFTIPTSVPTGIYQVKLQIKDPKTGEFSFSEVYERLIEVQ